MEQVWFVAALWPLVALVAGLIANWLKISTALSEIVVGTVAQICGWSISRRRLPGSHFLRERARSS